VLARDREFEREAVRHITAGIRVDHDALTVYSQTRADQHASEYGHDFPAADRNLDREALEELGDATNYVTWALDRVRRGLDDQEWKVAHRQIALRHIALAFDELRKTL